MMPKGGKRLTAHGLVVRCP